MNNLEEQDEPFVSDSQKQDTGSVTGSWILEQVESTMTRIRSPDQGRTSGQAYIRINWRTLTQHSKSLLSMVITGSRDPAKAVWAGKG